jgi:hypothetical protein
VSLLRRLLGSLGTPGEREIAPAYVTSVDAREIRSGLERLLLATHSRVADDVYQKVGSIAHSIVVTLPEDGSGIDRADPNVNLVRQTALSYLPEAMNAYLAIPRTYAESRAVDGGRTAHDLLMDQLTVMDERMREVADAIAKNDTDKLLANVRFLQERFASSGLTAANVSSAGEVSADKAKIV